MFVNISRVTSKIGIIEIALIGGKKYWILFWTLAGFKFKFMHFLIVKVVSPDKSHSISHGADHIWGLHHELHGQHDM